jgi:hypothetical protein
MSIPSDYHRGVLAEDMEFLEDAASGRLDRVQKQLSKKPKKIRATDCYGFTALHWAAYCGRVDMVDALLRNGADPNAMTFEHGRLCGWSPLHSAASRGSLGSVQLLLEYGAEQVATHLNHLSNTQAPLDMTSNSEVADLLRQGVAVRVVQLLPLAADSTVLLCVGIAGEELMRLNIEDTQNIKDVRAALAHHLGTPPRMFKFIDACGDKVFEDGDPVRLRSTLALGQGNTISCMGCFGDLMSLLRKTRNRKRS